MYSVVGFDEGNTIRNSSHMYSHIDLPKTKKTDCHPTLSQRTAAMGNVMTLPIWEPEMMKFECEISSYAFF